MEKTFTENENDFRRSFDGGISLHVSPDQAFETVKADVHPAHDGWGEPSRLSFGQPSVLALTESMLPETLRSFVADIANRMQLPLDTPGVASVCALAGATGRRVQVRPKQRDTGWTKTPNLWGGIIAPPGSKKTP